MEYNSTGTSNFIYHFKLYLFQSLIQLTSGAASKPDRVVGGGHHVVT